MPTLLEALDNLKRADVYVADALRRVDMQHSLVASMPESSEQKARAETLLRTMQGTLAQFRFHRDALLANISRMRDQRPQQTP